MNKKRYDLKKIWLLHHNNTKLQTVSIIRVFLDNGKIKVLAHPVYSPDFDQCNYWIFEPYKRELYNRHFGSDVELMTAVNRFFQDLPSEEFHKTVIPKWKERILVCTANDNSYFEKEIVDCDDDDDYDE